MIICPVAFPLHTASSEISWKVQSLTEGHKSFSTGGRCGSRRGGRPTLQDLTNRLDPRTHHSLLLLRPLHAPRTCWVTRELSFHCLYKVLRAERKIQRLQASFNHFQPGWTLRNAYRLIGPAVRGRGGHTQTHTLGFSADYLSNQSLQLYYSSYRPHPHWSHSTQMQSNLQTLVVPYISDSIQLIWVISQLLSGALI